jgi:hypothetical protein
MYDYCIYAYVVRIRNFTGRIESHIIGKELTLSAELRYFRFIFIYVYKQGKSKDQNISSY